MNIDVGNISIASMMCIGVQKCGTVMFQNHYLPQISEVQFTQRPVKFHHFDPYGYEWSKREKINPFQKCYNISMRKHEYFLSYNISLQYCRKHCFVDQYKQTLIESYNANN